MIQTLTIVNYIDVQNCTVQNNEIIGRFYATDYYTERKFDNLSIIINARLKIAKGLSIL